MQSCTLAEQQARQWVKELQEEGPVRNIEKLVHDPLGSGYLYSFCASQFCTENMGFIIAVDKFMDYMRIDESAWDESVTWQQLDEANGINNIAGTSRAKTPSKEELKTELLDPLESETLISGSGDGTAWPSPVKVHTDIVQRMMLSIWRSYLDDAAEEQICLPALVLVNTVQRMKLVHIYGPQVFLQAMIDPIKTIRKDIAMRFQSSTQFTTYLARCKELLVPSCAVTIHVPNPTGSVTQIYTKTQLQDPNLKFELDEILEDKILYSRFLKYLNRCIAAENIRFIRSVRIFRYFAESEEKEDIHRKIAWAFRMYTNFLVEGSAYEICVTANVRRNIMRQLASPTAATFDEAERVTYATLQLMFDQYTRTPEYASLRETILERYDGLEKQHGLLNRGGGSGKEGRGDGTTAGRVSSLRNYDTFSDWSGNSQAGSNNSATSSSRRIAAGPHGKSSNSNSSVVSRTARLYGPGKKMQMSGESTIRQSGKNGKFSTVPEGKEDSVTHRERSFNGGAGGTGSSGKYDLNARGDVGPVGCFGFS
mmetsp:Transcript_9757/g.16107  ORF Transcript_9757/g.16107 Transcript_9757/m.16107 type:complete len:538 (+) Transcript_9757:247-1860(+)